MRPRFTPRFLGAPPSDPRPPPKMSSRTAAPSPSAIIRIPAVSLRTGCRVPTFAARTKSRSSSLPASEKSRGLQPGSLNNGVDDRVALASPPRQEASRLLDSREESMSRARSRGGLPQSCNPSPSRAASPFHAREHSGYRRVIGAAERPLRDRFCRCAFPPGTAGFAIPGSCAPGMPELRFATVPITRTNSTARSDPCRAASTPRPRFGPVPFVPVPALSDAAGGSPVLCGAGAGEPERGRSH